LTRSIDSLCLQNQSISLFDNNINRHFMWLESTVNDVTGSFNSSLPSEVAPLNCYNLAWLQA
jgi:hypothetical protein